MGKPMQQDGPTTALGDDARKLAGRIADAVANTTEGETSVAHVHLKRVREFKGAALAE